MDEFSFIAQLTKRLPNPQPEVLLGIGDDAAVVQPGAHPVIMSTDTMVEGVHFLSTTLTDHNLGYKSLVVSISDMAAMGGRARYALVSLAIPRDWDKSRLETVYDGFAEATRLFGCDIIGGDVVSTEGPLVVTTTVVGEAARPVTRSGAKPGDIVFVTGRLGGSSAGLEVLQGQSMCSKVSQAVLAMAHQRPVPRLDFGQLASSVGVHALNDISDGLASELNEIAAASGVRLVVEADKIPVLPEVKEHARGRGKRAIDYALYGGEDYELAGTAPPHVYAKLLAAMPHVNITQIGRCEQGDGVVMRQPDGVLEVLEAKGYNHFKSQ